MHSPFVFVSSRERDVNVVNMMCFQLLTDPSIEVKFCANVRFREKLFLTGLHLFPAHSQHFYEIKPCFYGTLIRIQHTRAEDGGSCCSLEAVSTCRV